MIREQLHRWGGPAGSHSSPDPASPTSSSAEKKGRSFDSCSEKKETPPLRGRGQEEYPPIPPLRHLKGDQHQLGERGREGRSGGREGGEWGVSFQTNPEGTKWDYWFPAAWGVVSRYQRAASGAAAATSSCCSSCWSAVGLQQLPTNSVLEQQLQSPRKLMLSFSKL